jgi:2-haloacid dehalogenase
MPGAADIEFDSFDVLTFDCYGTLIDWESGLLAALRPVLAAHRVSAPDGELLEIYARHEAELEAGDYLRYRELLGRALEGVGRDLGFEPTPAEVEAIGASVGDWPAFEDSAEALGGLHERFKLAPITNCDDDLFALSAKRLGVDFDWVITAQQARSYKPSPRPFELAFATIDTPRERILHVAQSLFHDHVTAKALGMTTVWINRRAGRAGHGATPPAEAEPDATFPDMRSFATAARRSTG